MTRKDGHGISLKSAHYRELLERRVPIEWAEAVTENFLGRGGRPAAVLEHVRRDCELILHGVSMSLGGLDPFDPGYFAGLRALCDRVEPAYLSDHLCFGAVDGQHGHDLWPLPWTEESLAHVCERIRRAQDLLGRQVVIENVSSYVAYVESSLGEAEFLAQALQASDAGLLLDVNNVYVSAQNLGFDPRQYIDTLPADRVRYIHLAGHADAGTHLVDNHGAPVCPAVWALYEYAIRRLGPTPTIVEWDSNLPGLDRMLEESERARSRERAALDGVAA